MTAQELPAAIRSEGELEQLLATPYPETVDLMHRLEDDILILGAGGKMGPSLARLAAKALRLAGSRHRVIAVSRFSDSAQREQLELDGIETISCDLLDPRSTLRLPRPRNIVFMAGRKFGVRGTEPDTWMNNVVVAENAARLAKGARVVAFSTGCVYPMVKASSGGSLETDLPGPVGEYANSCLGRERIFQYHAERDQTPVLLYRLNYAVEPRYGVLHDIATAVRAGKPIDLAVNALNFIWQGDANNRALLCLEHAQVPANTLNITGAEIFSVRAIAERFARLLGVKATFVNDHAEVPTYLSNAARSNQLFGPPRVPPDRLFEWQADWVARGGASLGKPTHFQVKDGQFLDSTRTEP